MVSELLLYILSNFEGRPINMTVSPLFVGMITELCQNAEFTSPLELE